eukprot:14018628-Ditylum_brightwellii.AAC.1
METGYIQTPKDVHDALKCHFETDGNKTWQKSAKNQVKKHQFMLPICCDKYWNRALAEKITLVHRSTLPHGKILQTIWHHNRLQVIGSYSRVKEMKTNLSGLEKRFPRESGITVAFDLMIREGRLQLMEPLLGLARGDNAFPLVQSNRDLILTGFDKHMHQVLGMRTRAPRQRTIRSNRMEDFQCSSGRDSLQTTEGYWYRREFDNLWRMNAQVRDEAMEQVGLLNR